MYTNYASKTVCLIFHEMSFKLQALIIWKKKHTKEKSELSYIHMLVAFN